MATITTRPNLYQLGLELGGNPGFRMIGPDDKGVFIVTSPDVDEGTLEQVLAAHRPDPSVVPPPGPPEKATTDELLAAAIAVLIEREVVTKEQIDEKLPPGKETGEVAVPVDAAVVGGKSK